MYPFLILLGFLSVVGISTVSLIKYEAARARRLGQERAQRVADFTEAMTSELRKVGAAKFDLIDFAEVCDIAGDEAADAAARVYRSVCRKVMEDGVVTSEEETLLSGIGDALELDIMGRARLLREARDEWEREQNRTRNEVQARIEALKTTAVELIGGVATGGFAPIVSKTGVKVAKAAAKSAIGAGKKSREKSASKKSLGGPRTIRSKVSGVTFTNDDGSSRQDIIRTHCAADRPLFPVRERDNPYGSTAIALYTDRRGLVYRSPVQIGYIGSHLSEDLSRKMDQGIVLEVKILEVTGGGKGRAIAP